MYEDMTYEVIMQQMLASVRASEPNLDTREGSVIWFALSPAAIELQNAYLQLDVVLNETFADTASRPRLIKRCAERGISPYPATKAVYKGEFTPQSVEVQIGMKFTSNNHVYSVTEKTEAGEYRLACDTAGSLANNDVGPIIPAEYIDGLETAKLTELLIPGEDEESTESLRSRYLANPDVQAFGGNIADYQTKVNALAGVGGVKVYPVWNGGGTVKLVIIDSTYAVPSEELVNQVQTAVDPVENHAKGTGLSPIGHRVTVAGVGETTINIVSTITYQEGWTWNDVKTYAEDVVDSYFHELAQGWADSDDSLVVRISQIETRLLSCPGIIDVTGTALNGQESNIVLDADSIPIRGTING